MSTVTSTSSYIFNTDIGNMAVQLQEVSGYDVEDVIADRAFSQAQILRFQQIANNIDVNALMGTRAIASSYLTPEE
jgi:hypothetical protein